MLSKDRFRVPRPDRYYHRLRKSLRRPSVDPLTVREILAVYGLASAEEARVPADQGRNESLFVNTGQGKKVLKQYKRTTLLPAIIHEHSILRHLAEVGFPAPRLVSTCAGETVVCHGRDNYALFDQIEGGLQYHNYWWLPSQTRRFIMLAGEVLAVLHRTLAGFVPEGHNPNGFRSHTKDRWRDLGWYVNRLRDCTENSRGLDSEAPRAVTGWLVQQAEGVENRLGQLDRTLKEADLPRSIIHADYGPYNLLFRQDALVAVLDFEVARLDWRITEFVYAFPRFAHSRLGFSFDKMRSMLDAYRASVPIGDDEIRFIPAIWQFVRMRRAIVCWHRYCKTYDKRWLLEARDRLNEAIWMGEHQARFVEQLIAG
jgi:Ser/Thr protein kinase RdoA (MazF antagonist)